MQAPIRSGRVTGKVTGQQINVAHKCPECEHWWNDHAGPVINWERQCSYRETHLDLKCPCMVDLHKYPQALWDRVPGWNEPHVDVTRQCKKCSHVIAQHAFKSETDACYEYKCAVLGCTCPDMWLEKSTGQQVDHLFIDEVTHDPVNHPSHYTSHPSGIECIAITEHYNFCLGNAIKYIWRAGLKGETIEDLEKARWYLDREIARRKGSKTGVQAQDTREDSIQGGS